MGLKKTMLIMLLNILNIFKPLMPVKQRKITFISLTADTLEQDFKIIDQVLKTSGNYDVHYNLVVFKKGIVGNFIYMLNCIKQLYEVNTSKLIILNDNNFVVTRYKRADTKVLQVWHACGAVKKFGNQIRREYPIKNYDYILSNSEVWKHAYAEAFGVGEEQVVVTGMPRVDALSNPLQIQAYKESFYNKYPSLKGSYLIVYAPTFRGNIVKGLRYNELDLERILLHLPKNAVILYKMHPLLRNMKFPENDRLYSMMDEDLYQLMCVCDCLVSDYSSIIFDYSLLSKKMVCYASDYTEYEKTIGFNIDYQKEMPQKICMNENELITALNDLDHLELHKMETFQKKYMPFTDGRNAHRVYELIQSIMENDTSKLPQ